MFLHIQSRISEKNRIYLYFSISIERPRTAAARLTLLQSSLSGFLSPMSDLTHFPDPPISSPSRSSTPRTAQERQPPERRKGTREKKRHTEEESGAGRENARRSRQVCATACACEPGAGGFAVAGKGESVGLGGNGLMGFEIRNGGKYYCPKHTHALHASKARESQWTARSRDHDRHFV